MSSSIYYAFVYNFKTLLGLTYPHDFRCNTRTRFSAAQLRILMRRFEINSYISNRDAKKLADVLQVSPGKVLCWFRYYRSKGEFQDRVKAVEGRYTLNLISVLIPLCKFVYHDNSL